MPRCQEDIRPITRPGRNWAMAGNRNRGLFVETKNPIENARTIPFPMSARPHARKVERKRVVANPPRAPPPANTLHGPTLRVLASPNAAVRMELA